MQEPSAKTPGHRPLSEGVVRVVLTPCADQWRRIMFEERLAQFSRDRLDGRPVPDDVRVMLVAQWEARTDFSALLGMTFLER
ncbi:hypothetical protein M271_45695 [Streptomyces rapamycinicus NRRL 5491]|nr:hypothetical protein M271_45695 [Streptomyces rapamycinicus NRRL 5491]